MFFERAKKAVRHFHDTWVSPKDEPTGRQTGRQPGEIHYIAPGGKMQISAVIANAKDEQEIKKVLNILLVRGEYEDFFSDMGRTD